MLPAQIEIVAHCLRNIALGRNIGNGSVQSENMLAGNVEHDRIFKQRDGEFDDGTNLAVGPSVSVLIFAIMQKPLQHLRHSQLHRAGGSGLLWRVFLRCRRHGRKRVGMQEASFRVRMQIGCDDWRATFPHHLEPLEFQAAGNRIRPFQNWRGAAVFMKQCEIALGPAGRDFFGIHPQAVRVE